MKHYGQLFVLFIVLSLHSCGYYCYVDALSVDDSKRTYYIPECSQGENEMECKLYTQMLHKNLQAQGFVKKSPEQAELMITLNWSVGNMQSTTYRSTPHSLGNSFTTYNNVGNGMITSFTTTSTSYSSYTHTSNSIPFQVVISAYSTKTNEQVWKVTITDKLEESFWSGQMLSLQEAMPIVLYAARPYYGKTANAKPIVQPADATK